MTSMLPAVAARRLRAPEQRSDRACLAAMRLVTGWQPCVTRP